MAVLLIESSDRFLFTHPLLVTLLGRTFCVVHDEKLSKLTYGTPARFSCEVVLYHIVSSNLGPLFGRASHLSLMRIYFILHVSAAYWLSYLLVTLSPSRCLSLWWEACFTLLSGRI
jgi:hypothetical protein